MFQSIRNEFADTWTITKRNLIRYIRLPQLLFFSSVQPIMFLTLFNFVFGGAIGAAGAAPGPFGASARRFDASVPASGLFQSAVAPPPSKP